MTLKKILGAERKGGGGRKTKGKKRSGRLKFRDLHVYVDDLRGAREESGEDNEEGKRKLAGCRFNPLPGAFLAAMPSRGGQVKAKSTGGKASIRSRGKKEGKIGSPERIFFSIANKRRGGDGRGGWEPAREGGRLGRGGLGGRTGGGG